MARRHFDALDGLRGIFALCVAYLHSFGTAALPGGYLAVDFFFILSGFVVAHAYEDKVLEGKLTFSRFAVARIARLYPLHVLTMFIVFFLNALLTHMTQGDWTKLNYYDYAFYSFFTNLFLVHNIGLDDKYAFNGVSWSISVEIWLNFLLFSMFILIARVKLVYVLAIASIFSYIYIYQEFGDLKRFKHSLGLLPVGLWRGVAGISLGYVLHVCYRQYMASGKQFQLMTVNIIASFCVGMLVVLVLVTKGGATDFLTPVFAGVAVLLCATHPQNLMAKLFSLRPFVFLGAISYSVYLLHPLIIDVMQIIAGGRKAHSAWVWDNVGLYLLIFTTAVLLLSWLSFKFFETPMRRYINNIMR